MDFAAEAGADWLPIARKEGFVGQTQTCYADAGGVWRGDEGVNWGWVGGWEGGGWVGGGGWVHSCECSMVVSKLLWGGFLISATPLPIMMWRDGQLSRHVENLMFD